MPKTSVRKLDRESGMNRTSRSRKSKRNPPPPSSSSSEEYVSSDSELESELDIPAKDDSRRTRKSAPVSARKGKKDGRSRDFKGVEDQHSDLDEKKKKEATSNIAPHRSILLASTYHIGLSSVSRHSISSFLPSAHNYYMMVHAICSILVENTLLHELCPSFFSPVLFLYFGHVYYYHILRARAAAGSDVLTRLEKRALTYYERVGEPEAWPIPGPLLGFLEYFGAHKPEDPYFNWVVPSLPDLSALSANSLRNLVSVPGATRIPIIPALQQLVHNFGHDTVSWSNEILFPLSEATLSQENQFLGITSSTSTSGSFQALAFSAGWKVPCETNNNIGPFDLETKCARISRWEIPNIGNSENLSSLSSFLGFKDDASFHWMKHLLSVGEICCRFFPGSGTLGSVSPISTLGIATRVKYLASRNRMPEDHAWYYTRAGWQLRYKGYSNTEHGMLDTKMSIAVSANAWYSSSVIPAICGDSSSRETGPFFNNSVDAVNNYEFMAVPVSEGHSTQDPVQNFEQLVGRQYDNRAGR